MHQTKTGILLANLGTPDAPTPGAVKRYLRQFLSDKRVCSSCNQRYLLFIITLVFILNVHHTYGSQLQ